MMGANGVNFTAQGGSRIRQNRVVSADQRFGVIHGSGRQPPLSSIYTSRRVLKFETYPGDDSDACGKRRPQIERSGELDCIRNDWRRSSFSTYKHAPRITKLYRGGRPNNWSDLMPAGWPQGLGCFLDAWNAWDDKEMRNHVEADWQRVTPFR